MKKRDDDRQSEAEEPDQDASGAGGGEKTTLNIVAIGASAGGLAALRTLFSKLPDDTGAAFVIVAHLSPDHERRLTELLRPHCSMPVTEVGEATELEANHVYIIPLNANLSAIDTHLRLSELEPRARDRATVDHFFRTLAETHAGHAIGVILTGAGSDGTLGVRRIKEAGGVTLAQHPEEATHDGMPRSAIASGMIDKTLRLEPMAAEIVRLLESSPRVPVASEGEDEPVDGERLLQKIFAQVRARTGQDFSHYKRSMAMRRIARRMQLRHVETLGDYLDLIREDREEAQQLSGDLLITVTEFFRDGSVFEHLEREVIPTLLEGKTSQDAVRVWSVGCATGEEAYTIAMLLEEERSRRDDHPQIQVFASDLHPRALEAAREGLYPQEIESDVSEERLRRFFTVEDGAYRVKRSIRELVIFTAHNVLSDPPFSHLDLIVCRNLLIYLQRDVQRDVIALFHYALNPEGLLLLGSSETVEQTELFARVDTDSKLYRRRHALPREQRTPPFPLVPRRGGPSEEAAPGEEAREGSVGPRYGQMHAELIERLAPPSVLVNAADEVVHSSARAGRYLEVPGGEMTGSVLRLARAPLRVELGSLLNQARQDGRARRSKPIGVRFDGESGRVVLRVIPARERGLDGHVLVIFDELIDEGLEAGSNDGGGDEAASSATVRELRAELDLSRQRLQSTIGEYETSGEELQNSNEALQSSNEELRSAMEELETSKEELQSMNEELATVNQENMHRVEQLGQLADDLQNLLASTDLATLFLDRDLRIVRLTPAVGELFNIRPSDCGRPLTDLTHHLEYPDIESDARTVLSKLAPIEREVKTTHSGQWYLARLTPYRAGETRIEGVVITLIDITARKRAEQRTEESRWYAEKIVETLHEPLLVLHPDLTVKSVNPSFYKHFLVKPAETIGRKIYDLGNGQWEIPKLRELLEDVLPTDREFNDYQVEHDFEDLGRRVMLLNGRRLDHVQLILLGIRDITGRKTVEEAVRESEERFRAVIDNADNAIYVKDLAGRYLVVNRRAAELLGRDRDKLLGATDHEVLPAELADCFCANDRMVAETGEPITIEERMLTADGERVYVSNKFPLRNASGEMYAIGGVSTEVTAHRRAEQHLRTMMAELNHRVKNTLAVIQSIATRTLRRAPNLESFARSFEQRLQSIAQAHTLLTATEWEGASLRDVVKNEVRSHAGTPEQVELRGDDVQLSPRLVLAISMIIHELTTNACKYGAMRNDRGRLVVEWETLDDAARTLRLTWTEHCGEDVEPPGEAGYGSRLIHEIVEYELEGTVEQRFERDGLRLRLEIPLAASPSRPVAEAAPSPRQSSAGPPRVLVVEDRVALAAALCEELQMAGFEVIGPAASLTRAQNLVSAATPDVALLDVDLDGVPVHPLARRLREAGVPFALLTGFNEEDLPPDLLGAPLLAKPVSPAVVVRTLRGLLDEVAGAETVGSGE